MGWIASMVQDGCNYAWIDIRPVSDNLITSDWGIELMEHVPDVPYIQVGLRAYRVPYTRTISSSSSSTNTTTNGTITEWEPTLMGECVQYPSMPESGIWTTTLVTDFLAMVVGGGATFYVWISTCCRFSKPSWRWAGYEIALAMFFQSISFFWFANPELCGLDFTTCQLFYGSKGDILALVLWSISAMLIFCHYPVPKELGNQNDALVVNDPTAPIPPGSHARRKTYRTKTHKSNRRRLSRSKHGRTKLQSTNCEDDTDDLDLTIESSSSSYSESSLESPTTMQEVDFENVKARIPGTAATTTLTRDTSSLESQNNKSSFNSSSPHLDDIELI
jgi:hypothetical protein